MIVSLVFATSDNGVIGDHGSLPWHIPADLKHFKELTTGHTVIMGRKTYDSIGKPLPNRRNIIISRTPQYPAAGCEIATNINEALSIARKETEVFVIGGAEILAAAEPFAQKAYVTRIHLSVEGNIKYSLPAPSWKEIHREPHKLTSDNPYRYSFVILCKN